MVNPIPAGSPYVFSSDGAPSAGVAEVFRDYHTFTAQAEAATHRDLGRRLVLCEPLSIAGEAPLIAASIASAASLCIEADAKVVRQSIRSGAIDFTVNNLDEALRSLKNEIRKGLSIAVCLEGDPPSVLAEMVERGVQPDLVCGGGASLHSALHVFLERGARAVNLMAAELPREQIDTSWHVNGLPGKWLPLVDEVVAACLPADDLLRHNWLKRAPRYLGRALRTVRYLPLTVAEMIHCAERLRSYADDETWAGLEVHFDRSNVRTTFRSNG